MIMLLGKVGDQIMSGAETILPKDYQFDYAASVIRDHIEDTLDKNIEQYNDVIDPYLEFDRDAPRIWVLSGSLARLMKSEDEPLNDVHATIYRAMTFALNIIDGLEHKDQPNTLSVKSIANIDGDIAEVIRDSTSEYLSTRPNIASLITIYTSEIEPEDVIAYDHHVEAIVGLVFMLRERQVAETYIAKQAEDINGIMDRDG